MSSSLPIREYALTPEAISIYPNFSFIVYDFMTGRFEHTLKDLDKGKVTKKQVYRVLGKIRKFNGLPGSVINYYVKRVKEF